MKHIQESIIGRKGMTRVPELREHDIVITGEPQIYMVLKDPEEISQGRLDPKSADKRQGILYCTDDSSGSLTWISLTSYTKMLEYEYGDKPRFDINWVYRGNYKWDPEHVFDVCSNDNLFELIQDRKYSLIWERK